KLVRIYATHGHFDHVMAAGEMPQSLHIHKNDIFLLKRLAATATYFLGYDPIIIEPVDIKFITPVKKRRVGDFEFEVIHTPGHTPGSVCFLFPKEKKIFTGDLLFKNGIGRYDFSYGNKIELFESLEKIWRLPPEITIYPGHGDKTTVALSRF
ncbi:MBL fold metallo-hydrolase, partial [Candidatus Roizmanbacteria bacterium]|nr:MBL fold metallo-hydrolase [Candidatus Roizmanbacteria bacterium]